MARCSLILLTGLILLPSGMWAQSIQGLTENPSIKQYLSMHPVPTTVVKSEMLINLPFFDDFTNQGVFPDPSKWEDPYAFVNNSFAFEPISVGVATLDAIDENGDIYAGSDLPTSSDRLTSLPIDLSVYTGLTDTVRLSFFYQAGGRGESPEINDTLLLEYYSPSSDAWQTEWFARADTFTPFRQVILAIPSSYYQEGFRFRFRNYTSMSAAEVKGGKGALSNVDCWNLDYIMLNTLTVFEHLSINDIALVDQPRELMDFYESVPWLHLNDAQSITRNTMHYVIRNLAYGDSVNVGRNYYQINLATGERIDEELLFGKLPPSGIEQRNDPFFIPFTRNDDSETGQLEVGAYLVTPADQFKQNDTSKTVLNFRDYYAYDDGTPEYGFGISGESTAGALLAYRFRLFSADTLRAVDIYFNKVRGDYNEDLEFQLCVWADEGGYPGELLYLSPGTFTPGNREAMPDFTRYPIDAEPELAITDSVVYVGWKQATEDFLNVGFDINRNNLSRTFVNINGEWFSPGNSLVPGSLMIRPVFGRRSVVTGDNEMPDHGRNVLIFPNPAADWIFIQAGNESFTEVRLIDMVGKILLTHRNQDNRIDVSTLPPGFYFIQLVMHDATVITRKIVIRHQ